LTRPKCLGYDDDKEELESEMKMGTREKKLVELLRSSDFSVGAAYRASSGSTRRESDDVRREKKSASVLFAHLRRPTRSGIALSRFFLLRKRSVIAT